MARVRIQNPVSGRLDQLLLEELRHQGAANLSRARLKEFFRAGQVRLGADVAEASWNLPPGSHEVTIEGFDPTQASEPLQARAAAEGSFLPIVYEDDELLVLHKHSGVPSVPHSQDELHTAVGSALAHAPEIAGVGRGGLEPGLLHRLDTGTSGLLAFAKTPQAFERLHQVWKSGRTRKIYRAIAAPGISPQTAKLTLGHDAKSSKRMRVVTGSHLALIRGKPLETVTRIIKAAPRGDYEIEIETGVMHQIRCTLAHLGAPIHGDPVYGGQPSSRLWLHAWRLCLVLANGTELWLEAALPQDWPESSS
jgi:23S rRNA pseudouridine1911/1915/1917 synthase